MTESVSISQSVTETCDSFGSQTFIVEYFPILIQFPIYFLVRSSVIRLNLFSEAEDKAPLSNAVIIGVVSGVGATIAICAGIVVFMFRHRRDQNLSDLSSLSIQRDQKTVSADPEMWELSAEEPLSDGPLNDEEAMEIHSNINMDDTEGLPPVWI
jgi:hypothetical protein